MKSLNFEFLRNKWPELTEFAALAERDTIESPPTAIFNLRLFAEGCADYLLYSWKRLPRPEKRKLENKLENKMGQILELSEIPTAIKYGIKELQEKGNPAAHLGKKRGDSTVALHLIRKTWEISKWLKITFDNGNEGQFGSFIEPRPDLTDWICSFDGMFPDTFSFCGRERVLKNAEDVLTRYSKGIYLIEGEPGRGKTAIIRELCSRFKMRPEFHLVEYFFRANNRQSDLDTFTRHLLASLAETFSITVNPAELRILSGTDLHQLLCRIFERDIRERLQQSKKQLIIVVDALDEAGSSADGKCSIFDRLPTILPEGAYLVVTSRPSTVPAWFYKHTAFLEPCCNLEEDEWKAEMASDARRYVGDETVQLELSKATLDEIVRVGAGNFLVLERLCALIRDGMSPDDISELLCTMSKGANGLGGFYRASWERLLGPVEVGTLDLIHRIAGVIATANLSRVPIRIVQDVAGIRSEQWQQICGRGPLGQFLDLRVDDTVGFYHLSFYEFLRGEIPATLPQCELLWMKFCEKFSKYPIESIEREYALNFLISHAIQATCVPRALKWITDWDFLAAKCKFLGIASVLQDIAIVRKSIALKRQVTPCEEWSDRLLHFCRRWTDYVCNQMSIPTDKPLDTRDLPPVPPNPPDADQTVKIMRRTEAGIASETFESDPAIQRFISFERFFHTHLNLLQQAPESLLMLAANSTESDDLANEAGRKLELAKTPWLKWINRPDRHIGRPLVIAKLQSTCDADEFINLRFSADGQRLIVWNTKRAEVWSIESKIKLTEIEKENLIDVSQDGKRGISFTETDGLVVWDFDNEEVFKVLKAPRYCDGRFSPYVSDQDGNNTPWRTDAKLTLDGKMAVTVDSCGNLDLWNLDAGILLQDTSIEAHADCVWRFSEISVQGLWVSIEPMRIIQGAALVTTSIWWSFTENVVLDQKDRKYVPNELFSFQMNLPVDCCGTATSPNLIKATLDKSSFVCDISVFDIDEKKGEWIPVRRIDLRPILGEWNDELADYASGGNKDEHSVALTADGAQMAVSAGNVLFLIDLLEGTITNDSSEASQEDDNNAIIDRRRSASIWPMRRRISNEVPQYACACITVTETPTIRFSNAENAVSTWIEFPLIDQVSHLVQYATGRLGRTEIDPLEFFQSHAHLTELVLFPSGSGIGVTLEVQPTFGMAFQSHFVFAIPSLRPRHLYDKQLDLSSTLSYKLTRSYDEVRERSQGELDRSHPEFSVVCSGAEGIILSADERVLIVPVDSEELQSSYFVIGSHSQERKHHGPQLAHHTDGSWNGTTWVKDTCLSWWSSDYVLSCQRLGAKHPISEFILDDLINSQAASCDGITFATCSWDRTISLWNVLRPDKPIVAFPIDFLPSTIGFNRRGDLIVKLHNGLIRRYRLETWPIQSLPLVTATRNFLFEHLSESDESIPQATPDRQLTGHFADTITATCPYCGQNNDVPPKIQKAIRKIKGSESVSPSLEVLLPEWNNPSLIGRCTKPDCGESFRYNPFIVDHSEELH